MQSVFDKPKVGKGEDTREDMAFDFGIGPMSHGHDTDQIVIFRLPESVLHHIAVQTCLYDLIGTPVHVIGYDDVLSEFLNILANLVIVLPEHELPLLLAFLNG